MDFLTQTAEANQGFALLPATAATKEELKAEQFQEALERQLEEAKAAKEAYWEKKLQGQRKLTSYFTPSTGGLLPGLLAAKDNPLAVFRGSRGPVAPACAQPDQLLALMSKKREQECRRA